MAEEGEQDGETGERGSDSEAPAPVRRGGRPPTQTPYNAADVDAVNRREEALARERKQRDRDLRHLLAQPQFQRFFVRLLEDHKPFARSYDTSDRRLIEEGEKMAIMKIFDEIDHTQPDVIIRIMSVRAQKNQEKL